MGGNAPAEHDGFIEKGILRAASRLTDALNDIRMKFANIGILKS